LAVRIKYQFLLHYCFQDRQEFHDVITQLREELRFSKAQNEKLKAIINCRDSEDMARKCSELSENVRNTLQCINICD